MARRWSNRTFLLVGIGISLFLAGVVSYYASSNPDGLERVGADIGFIHTASDSAASGSWLANYSLAGIENGRLAGGLAGVIGVIVVAGIAFALFRYLGRGKR